MDGVGDVSARLWRRDRVIDPAADFERLVIGQLDRSYRLAAVILGSAIEAEDAVSDAALQAWQSRTRLRETERFDAWFARIVVNVCRDRLRTRKRLPTIDVLSDEAGQSIDFRERVHDRAAIQRGLEELSPDDQIVLVLRFWQDLSVDGIADRLGVPAGTVKSRLHHATRRLQAALATPGATR